MDFPARLRQVRLERKLTQEQLGKHIQVTKVSISCYENGSRTPDMETLQRIADVLDVSVDYLLGRTPTVKVDEQLAKEDPKVCVFLEEVLKAPKECRDELRKIWEIIKSRGSNN